MHPPPSIEAAFLAYRSSRDPAALARVYDGASARLLSVAIHLCKSPSAAEDVVQDTFLVALENPERWEPDKPLLPWLLGILSNRVRQVDGLSRRSIDPARLLVPDSSDPQEDFEAAELLAQVDDAITHLPQPYRGVVLLRLRNGLSPADISIALGRNPNTVRTQLARGVEMLRKVLPGSVAVLLAGTVAPAASHAASRQVVIQRATELHAQLRAAGRAALVRTSAFAVVGTAAACLLAWSLWPEPPSPSPAPAARERTAPDPAATARVGGTLPASSAAPSPDDREESVVRGSALVHVHARGTGVPCATVELEPIRDPRVFVHNYSRPFGSWQSIEPARPVSRDRWRRGLTDADGRCLFADLAPGFWVCRSLGIDEVFHVQSARQARLELAAPENTTILHGAVLDPDGRPIPDAPIWKLNRRVRSTSSVIAHSDAHGRFAAAVSPFATLGAFHRGLAPVAVTVPAGDWTARRDVTLQFSEPGAMLTGRVLDANGRPCAGALVEIGQVGDLGVGWAHEQPKVLARIHSTITDDDGRYAFPSLVPGRTVLRARRERFGVAQAPVELTAGAPASCELRLPAEAVVAGTVRTASGAPAEGVLVRIGALTEFARCSAVTDADGRYRLMGVSPGRSTVAVTDLRGGFDHRELHVVAGEQLSWDAVLRADNLTIRGQVQDARGQPQPGAWVAHRRNDAFDVQQVGADGAFAFALPERGAEAPGSLHVFARDPRNPRGALVGRPILVLPQVRAGAQALELVLADRVAGGSLRGCVLAPSGGRAPWPCRLLGSRGLRRWHVDLDLRPDGSFAAAGLEPGTYRLQVATEPARSFGSIEVGAHGAADLGAVRVPAEAAAQARHRRRFTLRFPDRVCGADAVHIEAFDERGWLVNHKHQAACPHGAPNVFLALPPGTIRIRATASSGLVAERTLQVVADAQPRRAVLLEFAPR